MKKNKIIQKVKIKEFIHDIYHKRESEKIKIDKLNIDIKVIYLHKTEADKTLARLENKEMDRLVTSKTYGTKQYWYACSHTLNKLWFKFGIALGAIVAPVVMGIIFFILITPIGILMKVMGKDLLNNKYNKNINSYWIKRDKSVSSMKKQF